MRFPKELMSITELVNMGFPRDTLKQYSRIKDAPIIWTAGKGKKFFVTSKLEKFIESRTSK